MLDAGGGQPDPQYPPDGVSLMPVLLDPQAGFERDLYWRMNHRGQRVLRVSDWKYLRVDGHDYLFNLTTDARERANLAAREPERLLAMREQWQRWNESMPPVPADATVSPVMSTANMPQR